MSDDVAALRDEVALLVRSLHDAQAEHARGELDDDAFGVIERRDGARLEVARERLAALEATSQPGAPEAAAVRASTPPRRSRRFVVTCTLALMLAAATIGVVVGRPFAGATAPFRLDTAGKVKVLLTEGELSVATGQDARALTAFDAVLRLEPHNQEAFIEGGWLHYEIGLRSHRLGEVALGVSQLRRSLALAPSNGASHLYYGIVLFQHFHDVAGAKAQVLRSAELPESVPEEQITATMLYYFAHH